MKINMRHTEQNICTPYTKLGLHIHLVLLQRSQKTFILLGEIRHQGNLTLTYPWFQMKQKNKRQM